LAGDQGAAVAGCSSLQLEVVAVAVSAFDKKVYEEL
jgi:hypothetical protein